MTTTTLEPVYVQFDDNSVLPMLFGEHDCHLARLEQLLDVSITPRGNVLTILGVHPAQTLAQTILLRLEKRLRKGRVIDMAEVEAAVRLADGVLQGGAQGAAGADDTPANGACDDPAHDLAIRTRRRLVEPRSVAQRHYVAALRDHELVFGTGPAGTGKTYLAVAVAVSMLLTGRVQRIILSRPAVEAGERLGFLPGDLKEKIDPYIRPLYDALNDTLPADQIVKRLGNGDIEVVPLAFMRGRTLAGAYIILDEAQNTTPTQMKMFLTRLGEGSRMAVTGDLSQVDLPPGMRSGLQDALEKLNGVEGVRFVHFTDQDVVRHPMVARIVRAYDACDMQTAASKLPPRL